MTLAVKDHIGFYSSTDLKSWKPESEFGKETGAHGGVWECPDLFALEHDGKQVWVLVVNINPGGPNGGSATQYFSGDFNGNTFTPFTTDTKWLDYGPDEYAGITWSNTGKRKIFFGWMSNWLYANQVPTAAWRSATTIARELKLKKVGDQYLVASEPVSELKQIELKPVSVQNLQVIKSVDLSKKLGKINLPCRLDLSLDKRSQFQVVLSNDKGENLVIGYDKTNNQYFIDRSRSGKIDFQKDFAGKHVAPRFVKDEKMNMTLVLDVASVELFADDGLSVMTEIFFPTVPFNKMEIQSEETPVIKKLDYAAMKSIWDK
jgi:fructan beta-fructosidase